MSRSTGTQEQGHSSSLSGQDYDASRAAQGIVDCLMGSRTFNRAATSRRETATSPPALSSQRNVFTRSESQGHDVMWVSESVLCGSINRWRMRTICYSSGSASAAGAAEEHSGDCCSDCHSARSSTNIAPDWGKLETGCGHPLICGLDRTGTVTRHFETSRFSVTLFFNHSSCTAAETRQTTGGQRQGR